MKHKKTKTETVSPAKWKSFLTEQFKQRHVPYLPTLITADGIRIDFCFGARVLIPAEATRHYELKLFDLDSGILLYHGELCPGDYFVSEKRYYVRFGVQITVWGTGEKVVQVSCDLKGEDVLIRMPVETLGDTIAWISAVERFRVKHGCKVHLRIAGYIRPLFETAYPEIDFVDDSGCDNIVPFASYALAVFMHDELMQDTPMDYRKIPLHHCSSYILGVTPSDEPPKIAWHPSPRKHRKSDAPSVVIGSQASGGVKLWHHPTGWETVIAGLKEAGYRVISIDRDHVAGKGFFWNHIPRDAEETSGDSDLLTRCDQIAKADFFVGLGSGLSWLAWCIKKPIVLIGGFSEPWEEMPQAIRVYNPLLCHGCFNDMRYTFDNTDYMWCPCHKGDARQWECSIGITGKMVMHAIAGLPAYQKQKEQQQKQEKK